MSPSLTLIIFIFVTGWAYGRLAHLVVELIEDKPALRHWWHGLLFPARAALVIAWPLTAMWIFRNGYDR